MKVIFAVLIILNTVTSAGAARLSVSAPIANIRSGAGENYKILWKVEKYHPFEQIRTTGDWYYVQDYEGYKGWVYKRVMSTTPSVIVVKDNSLVRIRPNVTAKVAFSVKKGVSLKVSERKNEWLHIEHADVDKGWIHQSSVW